MKRTIGILLIIIGLIVPITCLVKSIQFNQECGGYLKQAADANTVDLALERLNKAIEYVETNNLTSGYTSILWKTEGDNIEFWYRNLKMCQQELETCNDTSKLEQTNLLLKIRESLTETYDGSTDVMLPGGISRYPHNTLYAILLWLSLVNIIVGICLWVMYEGDPTNWTW